MTQPFVKWAGGKRQLAPAILARLPAEMGTYYEPFVGGGAIFFALKPERFEDAVLNDLNSELMTAYKTLKDPAKGRKVIALLKGYPHDREFFNKLRAEPSKRAIETTARFIYLNRTGFNGLYRVNKKGEFNVPFGDYTNPTICDDTNLKSLPKALEKVSLSNMDFEASVEGAVKGDTVYFDPPYVPVSETSNFTSYTEVGFGLAQHLRLASLFTRLAEAGVCVLLSNADTPRVRQMYHGFKIESINARRNINSKGDRRGPVPELLISANL